MKYVVSVLLAILFGIRVLLAWVPPYKDGNTIIVSGRVLQSPRRTSTSSIVRFGPVEVRVERKDIYYGDWLKVQGEVFNNEVNRAVVLEHYKSKNILSTLHEEKVNFIKRTLPPYHASLVAGIVLGDKQNTPVEFAQRLKTTGTSHVVVASGTNVTLVAGFALGILVNLIRRKLAVVIALIFVWGYIGVAGFEAPLVRAGIMGSIAFLAQATGKVSKTVRILLVSFFVMLFIYPWWIVDVGMWLSFTATLSLILFNSKIDKLIHFVPGVLREGLSTSLAAQIGVSPILLFVFGSISLIGPLVNGLILWVVSPIMVIAMAALFVSSFVPTVGAIILLFTYPFTWWFITIVNLFS